MVLSQHLIRTFFNNTAAGNLHLVLWVSKFLPTDQCLQWSMTVAPKILVVLVTSHDQNKPQLRFYHLGREVINCGSGTLAAAALIDAANATATNTLSSKAGEFQILKRSTILGLSLTKYTDFWPSRIINSFWRNALGAIPKRLTFVADKKWYLIAEFDTATTIKSLQPNFMLLTRYLSAALIATAKTTSNSSSHYVMRYFAPRYGNPEDSATGSANFLLVQYWWSRFQCAYLVGRQVSKQGGQFYGRVVGNRVELYGQVRFVSGH